VSFSFLIALGAGKAKEVRIVGAAVLLGDDVLQMES
jgi:hypothetical protein